MIGVYLERLTKVQGVTLVIFDDELARPPQRFVHFSFEPDAGEAHAFGGRHHVVRLEVEVEVIAEVNVCDRRILLVDEFQMNDVPASAHTRIKVFVLELEGETESGRVEADRGREVGRAQLGDDVGNLHGDSSGN
jgi:hypothetical protein